MSRCVTTPEIIRRSVDVERFFSRHFIRSRYRRNESDVLTRLAMRLVCLFFLLIRLSSAAREAIEREHGIARDTTHVRSSDRFSRVSPHSYRGWHVLYSNTDITFGLDRCSSVMRLRLMIRDRIFRRIKERSTQIASRHAGRTKEKRNTPEG